MSEELSRAGDQLLASTMILSHQYGIPSVTTNNKHQKIVNNSHNSKGNSRNQNTQNVHDTEAEYVTLYSELSTKTNHLLYLSKLAELQKASELEINRKYNEIVSEMATIRPDTLEEFLRDQNSSFKTNSVLNSYLQSWLPILHVIHLANEDMTLSELAMLDNLDDLFLVREGKKGRQGLVFTVMDEFQKNVDADAECAKLENDFNKLLIDELKPKLLQLKVANGKLLDKSNALTKTKEDLLENDSSVTTRELSQVREAYVGVVKKWNYLLKMCDFLPSFVASLPVNWYSDSSLFDIIKDCEKLAEKLEKYQLLVNVENIGSYSDRDLILLEFDEL